MKPPIFRQLEGINLVGKRQQMSFANNQTFALWNRFMPYRHLIENVDGTKYYSLEIYPPDFFESFDTNRVFEKWAAVAVSDFRNIPDDMETLIVPDGLYAVFSYQGPASYSASSYRFIFQDWLPQSGYQLSERPHFAVMGEKYKHNEPDSEEEIWIPVSLVGQPEITIALR